MSEKKGGQSKQPDKPTKRDGTDYNEYRRKYDSGRPSTNKSDKGTSGTGPREKKE